MKLALIIGISGQDGSYLANFLLKKKVIVRIYKKLYRPSEVNNLIGDFSKVRNELNWLLKVNFH